MTSTESFKGRAGLTIAHLVGMVDMIALPVWVGDLIQNYRFGPAQAGGLVTLFLVGVVLASLFLAPRFASINGRLVATIGFAGTGLVFFMLAQTTSYPLMAALHLVGGALNGMALSCTHGTIGRTGNPHRLFAIAQSVLGVGALLFLGATPNIIAAYGGPSLFLVIAGMMGVAALVSAFVFPVVAASGTAHAVLALTRQRFSKATWFAIAGVMLMALTQAMMFSFVERIGIDRGFEAGQVTGVLIALGVINLLPGVLAALLQKRLSTRVVTVAGPCLQAVFALVITNATTFPVYAVPAALFVAIMIFTHTFVFGLIARLEPTGRAVASTPAMLMTGAAVGPFLGGVLAQGFGYPALGIAATIVAAVSVGCYLQAERFGSRGIANQVVTAA